VVRSRCTVSALSSPQSECSTCFSSPSLADACLTSLVLDREAPAQAQPGREIPAMDTSDPVNGHHILARNDDTWLEHHALPTDSHTLLGSATRQETEHREPGREQNCDAHRLKEEDRSRLDNMVNMSPTLLKKTVTPFLKEHIPGIYAPIGKVDNQETARRKDPNSRYCYRHRPDSKCRKAADEKKMAMIQSVRVCLTPE
jgi:hypothetical protein